MQNLEDLDYKIFSSMSFPLVFWVFECFGIPQHILECPIYSLGVQGGNFTFNCFFSASKKEIFCFSLIVGTMALALCLIAGTAALALCIRSLVGQHCCANPLPSQFAAFHDFSHFRPVLALFFLFHPKCLRNIKTSIKPRKYTTKF